jgi:mono/diheme cytochrome c family protein
MGHSGLSCEPENALATLPSRCCLMPRAGIVFPGASAEERPPMNWLRSVFVIACLSFGAAQACHAQTTGLSVTLDGRTFHFSAEELLANPAVRSVEIPRDPAYQRPMRYRAIPLTTLVAGLSKDSVDTIEARASDGFVAQISWKLLDDAAREGSVAWIAIEDPANPWPNLAGKSATAGPYYLVWEHPERAKITAEQWPYEIVSLTGVFDPLQRWPRLSLDGRVSADDPSRRGQAVFVVQCLPCHRLFGAGAADMGPDLGLPMAATTYLTIAGLKALLRNAAAVRHWPQQQMPSFDKATLPDADIDAVIAYLQHITEKHH